jgi:purine nucleosidase
MVLVRPVIHDNDGHVDDLLSTILLWLAPEIDLLAVTVSDGDCYVQQAYEALVKIATFLDLEGAEIGLSEDPVANPFPENWRRESYIINELPIFSDNSLKKPYQSGRPRKTQVLVSDCLANSRKPVTVVTTGPLTNIAPIFESRPELKEKVEEIVIMGGAVNVPGNVEQGDHDGSAEWNLFADPGAAKSIFDSGIPIKLIPLDVTNQVPMTREFLAHLDEQADAHRASRLAAKIYSLVKGFNYYFWDTLTALAVIEPELFTFKDMRLEIVASGKSQGKTAPVFFGGKKVKVATQLQKELFQDHVLKILRIK